VIHSFIIAHVSKPHTQAPVNLEFQNSLTHSGKHAVTCIRPDWSLLFYLFDRYTCGLTISNLYSVEMGHLQWKLTVLNEKQQNIIENYW